MKKIISEGMTCHEDNKTGRCDGVTSGAELEGSTGKASLRGCIWTDVTEEATAEMWGESVQVSAQAEGSWTMTGKPQGSLLTQHLCVTEGAVGPGREKAAVLWGGSKCWGRKQVVTGGGKDEASVVEQPPQVGSCGKALWRLTCRGKSIYFD